MKKIYYILIFLILGSSLSFANESITIVRGQDFPPYHYIDENGSEKGFVIETINGVARLMEISVTYKQYPWSRCINMIEKGYADAMMNLFKTKRRMQFMEFSDNILVYETNSLFSLQTKELAYTGTISSLTPYKMGTIRNYSYGKLFDHVHFPINFQMETETELINSLINNRCEVIIGNKLVIFNLLKTMKLKSQIKMLSPDVSKDPLYISFSKRRKHKALSQSFSKHLKQFKSSQDYQKLIQAYSLDQ